MKITHNKGFDEDSEFRHKLKQKMDSYEPGVSETLWDRISVALDQQDNKNKKRGLVYWFWAGSLILTAGLSWVTYNALYNDDNRVAERQVKEISKEAPVISTPATPGSSETESIRKAVGGVIPMVTPDNKTNGSAIQTPGDNQFQQADKGKKNEGKRGGNSPINNTNGGSTVGTLKNPDASTSGSETDATPGNTDRESGDVTATGTEGGDDKEKTVDNEDGKILAGEKPNDGVAPDLTPTLPTSSPSEGGEKKTTNPEKAENSVIFNVSWQGAYNFRTVTNLTRQNDRPSAEVRDQYEHGAITKKNIGLDFGIRTKSGLFYTIGFYSVHMQNTVKFDQTYVPTRKSGLSVNENGVPKDSLSVGNGHTRYSNWNVTSLPLRIGFMSDISDDKFIGFSGALGISFNMMNEYEYQEFNALRTNDFTPRTRDGKYAIPEVDFHGFASVCGNLDLNIKVYKGLRLNVGVFGDRALGSFISKESSVSMKPYRFGAQAGFSYLLKGNR